MAFNIYMCVCVNYKIFRYRWLIKFGQKIFGCCWSIKNIGIKDLGVVQSLVDKNMGKMLKDPLNFGVMVNSYSELLF